MRVISAVILIGLALSNCAKAQSVSVNSSQVVSCCYATIGQIAYSGSNTAGSEDYAARVASWAVDLQLRNWLGKKPDDLSRDELKTAQAKLDVLCKWAKEKVDNKVFAYAYLQWASGMESTLSRVSNKLDHDEIAQTLLLHGLPTIPDEARN